MGGMGLWRKHQTWRGRETNRAREREETAGQQRESRQELDYSNGGMGTARQFWFGGWCLEGGPGGQSQSWFGVSSRGHQRT